VSVYDVVFKSHGFFRSLICRPLPEGKVVGHAENPAGQISPGPASSQVLKERKENFLDDFFSVVHRYPERENVAEQSVSKMIEQSDHFVLKFARREGRFRGTGGREGQTDRGISRIQRHDDSFAFYLVLTVVGGCFNETRRFFST